MPEQTVDILVVDDDDGHIELVRRNFRRIGLSNRLLAFTRGQEALDYIFCRNAYAERAPTGQFLILLDINMPGAADGIEVLRQLKADPFKKHIPVVMFTTTDDPREVNRCYELGCSSYITKPVDPIQFMETVSRLGLFFLVVSLPTESAAHERR